MDCLQTVSELYMCISSVSLPISKPYQTLVSISAILFSVSLITLHFCGGSPDMFHSLVVKLLTGFEAFDPPVKDFALAASVVILYGAFIVQILKGVGVSTIQ